MSAAKLHFVKFEDVDECMAFIKLHNLHKLRSIQATGGGAHKHHGRFLEELGIDLLRLDEMKCLVNGTNFLLTKLAYESFSLSETGERSYREDVSENVFPFLLVNIGSGVSVLKVDSATSYERVSGSSLGGGTFWGLCRLLTKASSFEEAMALSVKGKSANVDMLVGDIYGRDYEMIGLQSDIIASSMGRAISGRSDNMSDADIISSLLRLTCNNIAQIAHLNALRFNLDHIYFGGYFIRENSVSMESISFAIRYWSEGKMKANFLLHDGFLGALGAFMHNGDDGGSEVPSL